MYEDRTEGIHTLSTIKMASSPVMGCLVSESFRVNLNSVVSRGVTTGDCKVMSMSIDLTLSAIVISKFFES
jgi:hypothetical protein